MAVTARAAILRMLTIQARATGIALRHQLLFFPVTDARFDTTSYRDFAEGYLLTLEMMQWCWGQYLPKPSAASDPAASPLCQNDPRGYLQQPSSSRFSIPCG